jgi:hypothetical protein
MASCDLRLELFFLSFSSGIRSKYLYCSVHCQMVFLREKVVSTQVKATNLGLSLNLSNCSKMNKMHLCLNEIAWKASESSYMLPMFSNVISLSKHRMFIRHQLSTESSTRLHKKNPS